LVTISSLDKFLKEHRNVFIDTSLFIYHVEKHPRYHILCDKIFKDIETGRIRASTSTLSLLEILLQPYRLKNESLIFNFYSLLTTYPNLMWIDLTPNIISKPLTQYRQHQPLPPALPVSYAMTVSSKS